MEININGVERISTNTKELKLDKDNKKFFVKTLNIIDDRGNTCTIKFFSDYKENLTLINQK